MDCGLLLLAGCPRHTGNVREWLRSGSEWRLFLGRCLGLLLRQRRRGQNQYRQRSSQDRSRRPAQGPSCCDPIIHCKYQKIPPGFVDRGTIIRFWEKPNKFGLNSSGFMSALGHKQTCAVQNGMSALPPIATSIAFFGMSALGQKGTLPLVIRSSRLRACIDGGTLMPSALAALRLMTNSNLVACTTGNSAGFSPLRILPV